MLSSDHPVYVPIVLPNDMAALEHAPPLPGLMLSAVYGSNPRLGKLVDVCRQRAHTLLVDPKTPYFQFEGYMSMPDYRALPYSPGRHTLGTLWEPPRFAGPEACRRLVDSVFAAQRSLGADVMMAPYFYVQRARHPWLDVSRRCAEAALDASGEEPVGVPISVDIDALLAPDDRSEISRAYNDLEVAALWVTIVNYDERRADPRDARAVLAFLESLRSNGTPVVFAHAGRTGLLALAAGAAGYASGTNGLENHPRGLFREMMGARPANTYYLNEFLVHLPVRTAQAVLDLEHPAGHPPCDCDACGESASPVRMVARRLALHALLHKLREAEDLRSVAPADRRVWLIDRFSDALRRSAEAAARLDTSGTARIPDGAYHLLEVLREAAGGPPATLPAQDDFD